jgi:uncharacterized protein involved in exopolysaccharide biosynthesis/Mrp family chromosome partitioning ATPase
MNDRKDTGQGAQASGISLGDIYYILFRHKWKIVVLSTLGVLAAAYLYLTKKPVYGSEAELLVRYVIDTKFKVGSNADIRQLDPRGDNTLNSEVRIFTSFDLATNVVKAIGAEKILGGPDPENDPINKAAKVIRQNITVEPVRRTDVLRVVFQHPNKDLVQPILAQLINSYLDMHVRIHSLGVSETFLTQRTIQLSNQLAQTESQLRQAKAAAGVVSTLEDAKKEHSDMISAQVRELNTARADLAGHEAALGMFSKPVPVQETTNAAPAAATAELPADVVGDYKELDAQLQQFLATRRQLLTWATDTSYPVQDIQAQIKDIEQKKKALEAKYPRLASMPSLPTTAPATAGSPSGLPAFDPLNEEVQVRILSARIESMNSKLTQLRQELSKIEASEAVITELQRKREIEDADYRIYENSLHQAKITHTLEEGRLSNISVTQEPTPPFKDTDRTKKMCMVVAGGGFGAGLALAVLLELFLNQTVRRPNEIETRLRLPLMLSIPDTRRRNFKVPGPKRASNGHALLKAPDETNGEAAKHASMEVALWDNSHDLRLYFEALRDRLFVFFDTNNLKHNPKLVAVTACSEGAGVSTIAAGLAATLSETGDGNVLLVDMNDGEGAARPFYKGKPTCGIADALEGKKREGAMVQNNLYVVAEGMNGGAFPDALPKQFNHLMPKLKASDYDFIIFDMPPVSQISVTPKMARMMDINLLIVESEKTEREIVKQASSMISGSKANLGIVLNKKRSYVPKWLQQEL